MTSAPVVTTAVSSFFMAGPFRRLIQGAVPRAVNGEHQGCRLCRFLGVEPTVRPLTADDADAARGLGREAFGALPAGVTPPSGFPLPGRHDFGCFAGDRLVAKVVGREYHSWWHGRTIPTNGVAGVAVAPEHRGSGLLDDLLAGLLADGLVRRGEVVSTLFATAPGIYRRFGYEVVGSLDTVAIPAAALAGIRQEESVTLRRATAADVEAVTGLYDRWAAASNGPLTRRGPSFPATAEDLLGAFTGLTLAEDETGLVGFCSWNRGSGYDESATVEVDDLLALTGAAYRALWRMLGTFSSVVGTITVSTSGADVARLSLPSAHWRVVDRHPYMLRVHDVPGALSGLPLCPPGWQVPPVRFSVRDDLLGTTDGDWVVSVEAGVSACVAGPRVDGGPVFTPRGLAMVWSGAHPCADARAAGQLSGGSPDSDRTLDLLLGGRQVHIRDYF